MISDLAFGSGSLVAQHVLVGDLARYAHPGPLGDSSCVLLKLLVSNTIAGCGAGPWAQEPAAGSSSLGCSRPAVGAPRREALGAQRRPPLAAHLHSTHLNPYPRRAIIGRQGFNRGRLLEAAGGAKYATRSCGRAATQRRPGAQPKTAHRVPFCAHCTTRLLLLA
jgi:hypothetical protein